MRPATRAPVPLAVRAALALSLSLFLTLASAPTASAQYIYLDSNGDGVHSTADVLNPAGGTLVDVWLDTAHNRDGSAAVCATWASPMTFFSYEFCLRAVNGEVSFSDFVNQSASCQILFGVYDSSTEFYAGFGGSQINDPGLFHLASVRVSIARGSPSLEITTDAPTLDRVAPWPPFTAFGSQCAGVQYDHTIRLGVDFFDADGLPPGASAPPGGGPLLGATVDMTVAVGEPTYQALTATDPDSDPISLSMTSGPAFADVTLTDPGRGSATGRLHVAPFRQDVGHASVEVTASDGQGTDRRIVDVQVTAGPNHAPRATLPASVSVAAGSAWSGTFLLADADGQVPGFAMTSGSDFVTAGVRGAGPGGALAFIRIGPSLCDAGVTEAVFEVSDGIAVTEHRIRVEVLPEPAAPPPGLISLPTRFYPGALAAGDLNGDGLADLVVANEVGERMSVFLARPGGSFAPEVTYPTGTSNSAVALGDFDEDGDLDVALSWRVGNTLQLFRNRGDGSLERSVAYPTDLAPTGIDVADLDADGHLDLVIANGSSSLVSIFLGEGDGTFGARRDERALGPVYGVTTGDWNHDGRLDIVAANAFGHPLSMLLGHGDGTFRTHRDFPAGRTPFSSVAGDWDRDGNLDLAVADFTGLLIVLSGDGDGGFAPTEEHASPGHPQSVTAGDLDGDGLDDLVLCDIDGATAIVFRGDGNGRFTEAERIPLPRGSYQAAIADFNGDAIPDLALSDFEYGAVFVRMGSPPAEPSAFARAFVPGGHRPALAIPSAAAFCARLEPIEGSFEVEDVDPSSLALVSEGTGTADRITAVAPKHAVVGDVDHNGVPELPVCFLQQDLARLFDAIRGRRVVDARLEGTLRSGRGFCTRFRLDVLGPGKPLAASIRPLPLRDSGVLTVTTARPGALHVALFDLQGRLVRTLRDISVVPAGSHEIPFDGRDRAGRPLASGVYFYRIEAAEGSLQGRLTVLK